MRSTRNNCQVKVIASLIYFIILYFVDGLEAFAWFRSRLVVWAARRKKKNSTFSFHNTNQNKKKIVIELKYINNLD